MGHKNEWSNSILEIDFKTLNMPQFMESYFPVLAGPVLAIVTCNVPNLEKSFRPKHHMIFKGCMNPVLNSFGTLLATMASSVGDMKHQCLGT